MKICKDCRHFSEGKLSDWCTSPKNGINIINGLTKTSWAASCRSNMSKCGVTGKWFEPKIITPSLVSRIKAWWSALKN